MKSKSSTTIWMPIYIGDHFTETRHLTARQQGAYIVLLMVAWGAGGVLPADEPYLANIARLSEAEWTEDRPALARLFEISDSEWRHPRLAEEWQKAEHNREVRTKAGSKGLAKRWQKDSPSPSPSPSSEANASGEPAPVASTPKDLTGVVFDLGLRWLIDRSGRPETHCRSLLGKWRKKIGADAALIELLSKAQREGVIDPVPWMERAVAARTEPEDVGWN